MSDNFYRKVCNELGWIAVRCQLLHLSTQLDKTNLGQPIAKKCLILFSPWCKNVALAIKEKHLSKTWSGQCLNNFWSQIFKIDFTEWIILGIMFHSLLYFAILIN